MLHLFFGTLLLFSSLLAHAQEENTQQESIKMYRGIRSLSMGGLLDTTGLYSEALFGNPARHSEAPDWKLSILDTTVSGNLDFFKHNKDVRSALNASGTSILSEIAPVIGKNLHARADILTAYYNPKLIGDLGFAIGWLTSVKANLWARTTTDVSAQAVVDAGPNLGFSHPFLEDTLSIGVNIHLLYRAGLDQNIYFLDFLANQRKFRFRDYARQGIGLDSDIGFFYKIPLELPDLRVSLAATIHNIVKSHYSQIRAAYLKEVPSLPVANNRAISTGVRLDFPDTWIFESPLFALEFQDIGSKVKQYSIGKMSHFGGEAKVTSFLALRAGMGQGYFAGGLGFDLPIVKIDLGTYGEELTGIAGEFEDRRYMLRLAFEI